MIFFGNLKHKTKTLKCAWQHFGIQNSFWIRVKLDIMVRWRGLDKINVHKIYNVHYFNYHKPHVCDSWHITKMNKILQCLPIKSPFFFLR
jgi:hypothetical protein